MSTQNTTAQILSNAGLKTYDLPPEGTTLKQFLDDHVPGSAYVNGSCIVVIESDGTKSFTGDVNNAGDAAKLVDVNVNPNGQVIITPNKMAGAA